VKLMTQWSEASGAFRFQTLSLEDKTMQATKKSTRRLARNLSAVVLDALMVGSVISSLAAQIPNSRPKPDQGGVVKLHGQPYLVVSLPSGTPFQLSGGCVLGRPVLTFTVQVSNKGTLTNRAQPPETAVAMDDTLFPQRWEGQTSLPEIPPGQSVNVSISLTYVQNLALSGAHIFRLYVPGEAGKDPATHNSQAASSRVVFPDGYCAPPNSRPKPQQLPLPNKNPKLVRPGLPFSARWQTQQDDSWRGASYDSDSVSR